MYCLNLSISKHVKFWKKIDIGETNTTTPHYITRGFVLLYAAEELCSDHISDLKRQWTEDTTQKEEIKEAVDI